MTTPSAGIATHIPPVVKPSPAYVASDGARQAVTSRREGQDIRFTPQALALINAFLDHVLYNFLGAAQSTQLPNLRAAVTDVLKGRLAREAIASADEELEELADGGVGEAGEDGLDDEERATPRPWDLNLMWKRTRLRVMVYMRLGEVEDEEEERYVQEDELFAARQSWRFSQISGLVSWASAIFLTGVLEHIAEQTLQVAVDAAEARTRRPRRSIVASTEPDLPQRGLVVVQDHDVEKIALHHTLGRSWRTWRKSVRTASASTRPSTPRKFCRPDGEIDGNGQSFNTPPPKSWRGGLPTPDSPTTVGGLGATAGAADAAGRPVTEDRIDSSKCLINDKHLITGQAGRPDGVGRQNDYNNTTPGAPGQTASLQTYASPLQRKASEQQLEQSMSPAALQYLNGLADKYSHSQSPPRRTISPTSELMTNMQQSQRLATVESNQQHTQSDRSPEQSRSIPGVMPMTPSYMHYKARPNGTEAATNIRNVQPNGSWLAQPNTPDAQQQMSQTQPSIPQAAQNAQVNGMPSTQDDSATMAQNNAQFSQHVLNGRQNFQETLSPIRQNFQSTRLNSQQQQVQTGAGQDAQGTQVHMNRDLHSSQSEATPYMDAHEFAQPPTPRVVPEQQLQNTESDQQRSASEGFPNVMQQPSTSQNAQQLPTAQAASTASVQPADRDLPVQTQQPMYPMQTGVQVPSQGLSGPQTPVQSTSFPMHSTTHLQQYSTGNMQTSTPVSQPYEQGTQQAFNRFQPNAELTPPSSVLRQGSSQPSIRQVQPDSGDDSQSDLQPSSSDSQPISTTAFPDVPRSNYHAPTSDEQPGSQSMQPITSNVPAPETWLDSSSSRGLSTSRSWTAPGRNGKRRSINGSALGTSGTAAAIAAAAAAAEGASPQKRAESQHRGSVERSSPVPVLNRLTSLTRKDRRPLASPTSRTTLNGRAPGDFDALVQKGDTVKYTLTPMAARDSSDRPQTTASSLTARDARTLTSTRDFADFIRTTGPQGSQYEPNTIAPPVPTLSAARASSSRSHIRSFSAAPPQARSANPGASANAELIDFLRTTPPPTAGGDPNPLDNIGRCIDGKKSLDLNLNSSVPAEYGEKPRSRWSSRPTSPTATSPAARRFAMRSKPDEPQTSLSAKPSPDGVQRTRHRNKDPNAIDTDDEESSGADVLGELPQDQRPGNIAILPNQAKPEQRVTSPTRPSSAHSRLFDRARRASLSRRTSQDEGRSLRSPINNAPPILPPIRTSPDGKPKARNPGDPSPALARPETSSLAQFLKTSGPPEEDGAPAPFVGRQVKLNEKDAMKARKKTEKASIDFGKEGKDKKGFFASMRAWGRR
ncbi:hypothetical protein K470DRAFT_263773 [Piedraia hortae CBS 480.64]|uniref:Uncharacterized protein n=1 Tax=Piedraia hortae CBS 480.64 TaxID=1314780 RepID=A0A6A7C3T1_9PEZI|nr:hypothetical protein K470DRAFT_263773 [Piedraia hortae CBS 480.64]